MVYRSWLDRYKRQSGIPTLPPGRYGRLLISELQLSICWQKMILLPNHSQCTVVSSDRATCTIRSLWSALYVFLNGILCNHCNAGMLSGLGVESWMFLWGAASARSTRALATTISVSKRQRGTQDSCAGHNHVRTAYSLSNRIICVAVHRSRMTFWSVKAVKINIPASILESRCKFRNRRKWRDGNDEFSIRYWV